MGTVPFHLFNFYFYVVAEDTRGTLTVAYFLKLLSWDTVFVTCAF